MNQNIKKFTVASSSFLVATLFSFHWSAQNGASLSVEKAEARVGRTLTPVSVAGVARRHYRRAAIGTAAAVELPHGARVITRIRVITRMVLP